MLFLCGFKQKCGLLLVFYRQFSRTPFVVDINSLCTTDKRFWNSLKSVSMWQMWHNLTVEHVALLGLRLHLLQMDNDNKHSNDESSLSYIMTMTCINIMRHQNVLANIFNPVNSDSSILPALKVFCFRLGGHKAAVLLLCFFRGAYLHISALLSLKRVMM